MVVLIIPCTVDVRESVDIYPDDPRPDTELTKEFAVAVVLIIPCTVDVRERVEIYPNDPRPT